MNEVKYFKQSDLVLRVGKKYDPLSFDYQSWKPFVERLTHRRRYQEEAIEAAVVYLASGQYQCLADLARENFQQNRKLQEKYPTQEEFIKNLEFADRLYADLDLATGTGKSFVIYAVAQIMLGMGLVDRVLVLCPSVTIEEGLTEKFKELAGNQELRKLLPENAVYRAPAITNARSTIKKGDLCVENIHAVYAASGSSIADSLQSGSERVLVLNDESHHIFNRPSGNTGEEKSIKKWKGFLADERYRFRYMLGFTGTAYQDDEYFSDVIYRYSLKQAIEDHVVKNVDYVREDDSANENERFQKIYRNHQDNIDHYPMVKPLTILVTKDISRAKALREDLIDFLAKKERLDRQEVEKKVLIVTSSREHRANVRRLRLVDDRSDPTQWIVSVSMLTEGWDVKNVFQIVPCEERAFNSRLLVAQVLGRGLRMPSADVFFPKVTVFNHASWSAKIKKLVEEMLEIDLRVNSCVLNKGERAKHHFTVYQLSYADDPQEVESSSQGKTWDYSRLLTEGIALDSQVIAVEKGTVYDEVLGDRSRQKNYEIEHITYTIDEILDELYDTFAEREWEGSVLQLGEREYTKEALPPRQEIRRIIELSMEKRQNKGDRLVEQNKHKVLSAFSTLLRKKNKTVVSRARTEEPCAVSTESMAQQSTGIGNLRKPTHTVFYSDDWNREIACEEQRALLEQLIQDQSLLRSSMRNINPYLFKTPVDLVITSSEPERKFVEALCEPLNAGALTSWVKSRDRGFYSISYSLRRGPKDSKVRRYTHASFNPDFFLRTDRDGVSYFIVVEIKADGDLSEENKAKYEAAAEHFAQLNQRLEEKGIGQKYLFHFLTPGAYQEFFPLLRDGTVLKGQDVFHCSLENALINLE